MASDSILKEYISNPDVRPSKLQLFNSGILGAVIGTAWAQPIGWWILFFTIPMTILFFLAWDLQGYWRGHMIGYRKAYSKAEEAHNLLERFEQAHRDIEQMNQEIFAPHLDENEEDLPDDDEDLFANHEDV